MSVREFQLVPETPPTWRQSLAIGAGCLGVAVLARLALMPLVHHTAPFLAFFPALMAASIWGGRLGGGFVILTAPLAVWIERGLNVGDIAVEAGAVEVFLLVGFMMVWLGDALSRSVRQVYAARRRDAQAQLQEVIRELGHRARNGFAVVMALTEQSARGAVSVDDYRNRLMARLSALSASQDLITRARGGPVDLLDLFHGILDPFDLARFEWTPEDPDCRVDPETALALALVFHELATNALKYGSLSVAPGRVSIDLGGAGASGLAEWVELDGPPVAEPHTPGSGIRLLRTVMQAAGGGTALEFDPAGVRCRVNFRLAGAPVPGRRTSAPLRLAAE